MPADTMDAVAAQPTAPSQVPGSPNQPVQIPIKHEQPQFDQHQELPIEAVLPIKELTPSCATK
jgi:hypothetical protein